MISTNSFKHVDGILYRNNKPCGTPCGSGGHLSVGIEGKPYLVHRIIWLLEYGEWPKQEIDHIDGDVLNNKLTNLRDVSRAENLRNLSVRKDSKTGINGVIWHYYTYRIYIQVRGKRKQLGMEKDFFTACCIRKAAELKYKYHANYGRTKEK